MNPALSGVWTGGFYLPPLPAAPRGVRGAPGAPEMRTGWASSSASLPWHSPGMFCPFIHPVGKALGTGGAAEGHSSFLLGQRGCNSWPQGQTSGGKGCQVSTWLKHQSLFLTPRTPPGLSCFPSTGRGSFTAVRFYCLGYVEFKGKKCRFSSSMALPCCARGGLALAGARTSSKPVPRQSCDT